jgi:small subunit ribosomal protein S5
VTKSIGTSNPYNMIKATFAALESMMSPRSVAARRGKKVSEIVGRRTKGAEEGQEQANG